MKNIQWIRFSFIVVIVMIFVLLLQALQNNPLFVEDIIAAMMNLSIELILTFLLTIILLWLGLETNHWVLKNTKQAKNRVGLRLISRQRFSQRGKSSSRWSSFWQGISTEMIGSVITTILLGVVILIFQQYQHIQSQKSDLIRQMGSSNNQVALEAVRQLRVNSWHADGTLREISLVNSVLNNANLLNSNLQSTDFGSATLRDVTMNGSNLQDTNFGFADLTNAQLNDTNLFNAFLSETNLSGAQLENANLENSNLFLSILSGANLRGANLLNATINEANFDVATILPDGLYWTPNTNMRRYTDTTFEDFWNPCENPNRQFWYCD